MTLPTRTPLAFVMLAFSIGCGSAPPPDPWYPRTLSPTAVAVSDDEREILEQMEQIPEEGEVQAGGLVAFVESPYYSASDRWCRRVRLISAGDQSARIACSSPDGWRFVATVFDGEMRR